jgi:hypothetical protein
MKIVNKIKDKMYGTPKGTVVLVTSAIVIVSVITSYITMDLLMKQKFNAAVIELWLATEDGVKNLPAVLQ